MEKVHTPEAVRFDFDSERHYWIALDQDKWIAYCKGGPLDVPVDVGDRRVTELKQLYVERDYHGRGVADRLMQLFLNWAALNQVQDAYISCFSGNLRALAFYKRHGFEECGRYIFYVGKQEDDERILRRCLAD